MAEELGMIHYRVLQDVLLNAVSSSYTMTKANNILNKHNPTYVATWTINYSI